MKIISWNVNGIRSLKKSAKCVLKELDADICCFQETKISRSQLPENIAIIDGYTSYFSYPRKRSGYSGVATYCKDAFSPEDAEEGLSGLLSGKRNDSLLNSMVNYAESTFNLTDLDSEGRVMITYHLIRFGDEVKHLAVINVYCPRVDPEKPERHLYKMQFCHLLETRVKKLCEDGCLVMIVGDMNIAYSVIDHCDPGDENEFNCSEARQWFKSFLSTQIACSNGDIFMVDAFRLMYPDRKGAYTCWNTKTEARQTNYGTRIDHVIISSNLKPLLFKCDILSDYEGSDHCPVFAELKCEPLCNSGDPLPSICTRLWPEFFGKQQTLQNFLKKTQDIADNLIKENDLSAVKTQKNTTRNDKQKSITSFFKSPYSLQKTNSNGIHYPELKSHCSEVYVNCDNPTDLNGTSEESVSSSKNSSQILEWKSVLKGPPKPPLCSGHNMPCALRTVKKKGPNFQRQFFICPQPAGHSSNPDANCNFFKWVTVSKTSIFK